MVANAWLQSEKVWSCSGILCLDDHCKSNRKQLGYVKYAGSRFCLFGFCKRRFPGHRRGKIGKRLCLSDFSVTLNLWWTGKKIPLNDHSNTSAIYFPRTIWKMISWSTLQTWDEHRTSRKLPDAWNYMIFWQNCVCLDILWPTNLASGWPWCPVCDNS